METVVEDGYRLVAMFYEAVNESPAQIYTSALSFAPKCSLVDLYAKESRSQCLVVGRERGWGTCLNTVNAEWGTAQYSRDGQSILSWSWHEIVIGDAMTGNARKSLRRENEIVSADVHPYNRFVVFLLENGRVEEWEWASESQSTRIYALPEVDGSESTSSVGQVRYNGDGSSIVCHMGSVDVIFVWSTDDQTQPAKTILTPSGKRCVTFSLDDEEVYIIALLTAEGEPATVKRWNIETGEEVSSSQIEMDEVRQAVFAKNNKMLVSGHDSKICVWNVEGDCWKLTTTIHQDWWAFDVTRTGDVIASGYQDIYFWDARSGEKLGEYPGHTGGITSVAFSPQEDRLVSTSYDNTLRIWDTRREALSHSSDHTYFSNVTISPNGKRIAATTWRDVYVFDSNDGSLLAKFTGHTDWVISLVFSADGSLLATYSGDDGVFLWDVERRSTDPWTLSQSKQLGDDPVLTFNADATLLVVVSHRQDPFPFTIAIWNIQDRQNEINSEAGKKLLQSDLIRGPTPQYIRFDPTGLLFSLQHFNLDEKEVIIWDHSRNAVETRAYDENIHSALKPAFALEEGWIMSTRTRRRLLWLPEDRRSYSTSQFATNGEMIAVASIAGKLTVLDMSQLSSL